MVNSIKSFFEIDENIVWKFIVVYILENCVNNIKYSMLSIVFIVKIVLLIIKNVVIFNKFGKFRIYKFFKNFVINWE